MKDNKLRFDMIGFDFQESKKRYENAFNARYEYEVNCILKYDYPKYMNKPSKMPPRGERIEDFAIKHNTTVKEMKDFILMENVEIKLKKDGYGRY